LRVFEIELGMFSVGINPATAQLPFATVLHRYTPYCTGN